MAEIDLGKIAPIGKGDYISSSTYENLDIVRELGISYIATTDIAINENPSDFPLKWKVLVRDGTNTNPITGVAKQDNSPTAYNSTTYPNGLFETYIVVEPITTGSSWGIEVTQADLDENFVYFNVKNGVVSLFSTPKLADVNNITNITNENTYILDPSQIVPSEALYNDFPTQTLAGDVLKRVDKSTGEDVNYREVTAWFDGTVMDDTKVDGVIFIKENSKYYKRIYTDYADPRWFGAKGDGIDGGIGNYAGDHDAINLALRLCKKVILKNGVFIVKKPIVLNNENDLFIDVTATLKLGDASNCTLLKNSHVDIYKDGDGIPTYPLGFKRHKNIRIHGRGLLDFNGWLQNRSDSPGGSVKDNPAVVGTPRFADGLGIGNYYTGVGCKFADIDNFYMGGGLRLLNARTYTVLIGGIHKYLIDGLNMERTYYVQNQDGFDINGDTFDGIIRNVSGVSGDEFIVLATTSLGDETLRAGDIKRLQVSNINYWGINPASTPEVQLPLSTFEDGFWSHRLMRISNTKDYNIDFITVENCNATTTKLHAQIVISKLPYSDGVGVPAVYSGTGTIGNLTFRNIQSPQAEGFLDIGDYTTIKTILIENIIDNRFGYADPRCFIANYENFTGTVVDFTNSSIESLIINDVITVIGDGTNPSKPWIDFAGKIKNLVVNNYSIKTLVGDESEVLWNFLKSDIDYCWISNSDFSQFNKIFDLSNTDSFLLESNCTYKSPKAVETQGFARAITSTFVTSSDNIIDPRNGDIIRTALGLKLFNGTFWQNFNKPVLTTGKIPIRGIDDLADSTIEKIDEYTYSFGSSTQTAAIDIHKSVGFFGDTVPFLRWFYDGFNFFKSFIDGGANTVFEAIQKGTEQSGIKFIVNSTETLNLKKDGNIGLRNNQFTIASGNGTPEGSVIANIGSTYHRLDGGTGTSFYVKESGVGNTGWVAK